MDQEEIAEKVGALFESGGGDEENMWKIISQFAMQLDSLQILALTKLTFISQFCNESVKKGLLDFRNYYIALHNNRNTAGFLLRISEMQALKHFVNGIQGQVIKTDK